MTGPVNQFRSAVIDQIKTQLPAIKTVRSHAGQFGDNDLTAILSNSPAVHVAILGFRPASAVASGGCDLMIKAACFIVTDNKAGSSADSQALDIATNLVRCLDRWQPSHQWQFLSDPIGGMVFQTLYSKSQGASGQLLSSLSFDAVMRLTSWEEETVPPSLSDILINGVSQFGDAP